MPHKQAKKGRLWLNDGSCLRLRPERPNHVWSYDFVQDRTQDGRIFRALNIIDEFTKEALVIRVKRRLNSTDVVDALTDLFHTTRGTVNLLALRPEDMTAEIFADALAKQNRYGGRTPEPSSVASHSVLVEALCPFSPPRSTDPSSAVLAG